MDQYFPEAVFNENQVIVNLNARFTPKLSVMGFYTASWANSDGGGGSNPSNSYNLRQDYGRAAFVRPQWLFLMGNYTGPWAITFNPFLIAQAGRPYNITSPYDLTGDNFFNDRPSYAGSVAPNANNVVQTSFGALDVDPQAGETYHPQFAGQQPVGGCGEPPRGPDLRHWAQGGIVRLVRVQVPAVRPRRRRSASRRWWLAAVAEVAAVAVVAASAAASAVAVGGRGGPRRHVQHRPQILAELQRAGAEPLQRHRSGQACGWHSADIRLNHRAIRSGQRVWKIDWPCRRNFSTSSAARRVFFQVSFQF